MCREFLADTQQQHQSVADWAPVFFSVFARQTTARRTHIPPGYVYAEHSSLPIMQCPYICIRSDASQNMNRTVPVHIMGQKGARKRAIARGLCRPLIHLLVDLVEGR